MHRRLRPLIPISRVKSSDRAYEPCCVQVDHWDLKSAELIIQPRGDIAVALKIEESRDWSYSHVFPLIKNMDLGSATFNVGPVPFQATLQLTAGIHVDASATERGHHAGTDQSRTWRRYWGAV